MKSSAAVILLFLVRSGVWADQVAMKNGDRLTGTITKSDGKGLTMQSEYAGEVTIQWEAVVEFSSTEPLNLVLADEQKLVGTVAGKEGKLQVQTKEAGTVTVDKTAVRAIRNAAEESAYQAELERLRNPGLLDLWAGYFDVGLATARGNAQTTTFTMSFSSLRETPRDKLSFFAKSIRSTSRKEGVTDLVANATRGGVKYNLKTGRKTSVFGFTDLEFDEFQALDLRVVAGGGLDYELIRGESTTLDLSAGGSINKEFFSDNRTRESGEALLGQELKQRLLKVTTLEEKLSVYANLSERGEYRVNLDVGTVTRLNRYLSFQLTISNRYLSNPIAGKKKNDILFTTGLRVTFD